MILSYAAAVEWVRKHAPCPDDQQAPEMATLWFFAHRAATNMREFHTTNDLARILLAGIPKITPGSINEEFRISVCEDLMPLNEVDIEQKLTEFFAPRA